MRLTKSRVHPPWRCFCPLSVVVVLVFLSHEGWLLELSSKADGLPCDLFVTHAWAEGIYELIARVEHSWPRGMRGAYICFLSNPQNLNIEALIASPRESPFALALQSASLLLVCPNDARSEHRDAGHGQNVDVNGIREDRESQCVPPENGYNDIQ